MGDQVAKKPARSVAEETPAARFVRGCLQNAIWLGPLVVIGWPVVRTLPGTLVWYCVISVVGSGLVAALADPISLRHRQGQDQATEFMVGLSSLAALIWAAADFGRFHFSDQVPPPVSWLALAVLLSAYGLRIWAVSANAFFSRLIVIQAERGQRVVDSGPYAWIRHPGNLSVLLILVCAPLAVNSYLALGFMAVGVAGMLNRTRLEDRFLQANLPGYTEYAARVRYRLVPGVY